MKHDPSNDHDECPPPVPDCSSSDDENYCELLERMVKFGKKEMKDVEEYPGELISVIDWIEKSHKLESLRAMKARVVDLLFKSGPRQLAHFWYLMTFVNSEGKDVMVEKFLQFASSEKAINDLCDDVENYPELMDLAGTELKKIKQQFPNQLETMATVSELYSTTELFLNFSRGLKSLLFKIKMMELHLLYPCRTELEKLVDRMLSSVEREVEQYEQEMEAVGAKVGRALTEKLKKAMEEKKEGDHDDASTREKLVFRSLDLKIREWWDIVKDSHT